MRFSEEQKTFYLGRTNNCYVGYSSDEEVRAYCASGGIVSTILIGLLSSKQIDGALTSRLKVENGRLLPETIIATSKDEILSCGGSIYFDVNPLAEKSKMLDFQGRLAVVGLPCHLAALERLSKTNKGLRDKVILKIGLFCGHNSKKELIEHILKQKRIRQGDIAAFSFRKGRWRGRTELTMKNGEKRSFPFSHFSIYQNMHLFSLKKCLQCNDHTAEGSDISCGDIWLQKMKGEAIKHSIFLSRTQRGEEVIQMLIRQGMLFVRGSSPQEVFLAQKRSIIHHKNIYLRSRMARYFGLKIPPCKKGIIRWNDYISTLMVLTNTTISEKEWFRRICFHIPRPVMFSYLVLFKLLTNF